MSYYMKVSADYKGGNPKIDVFDGRWIFIGSLGTDLVVQNAGRHQAW